MDALFDVDLFLDIYSTFSISNEIGVRSQYVDTPHPGTGKTIQGWKWDERTWPSDIEIKANDYAPTIFDPSTNFLEESFFTTGIGDNNDLKLLEISEEIAANIRLWTPKIHHGHFYIYDQEWYLYSDDARKELMDASVLSGVLKYKDLAFEAKPGIPIMVRQYKWNHEAGRYDIHLNLRKKLEFTGLVVDGEELDTLVGSGDFVLDAIDDSKHEFIVDYERTPPRIVLNQLFSGEMGVSGDFDSLEYIGISDGVATEYHLPYAPVDPSGTFMLISWNPTTLNTYSWSRIPSTQDFTAGPYQEFKLDPVLGIITFGDYDETTGSGAGSRPIPYNHIGAVLTRGLEVTYEPAHTRDWAEPRMADVNLLHNVSNQGFIKVTSEVLTPYTLLLTAEMSGDVVNGYSIEMANATGKLIATVKDIHGNPVEGELIEFQILDPVFGQFANLETTTEARTNAFGQAFAYFVPPTQTDDVGRVSLSVADMGDSTTRVVVDGLTTPVSNERVWLFQVKDNDPTQGIPESELSNFYNDYLDDEDIAVDPDGSAASQDYEESFRDQHTLLAPTTFGTGDYTTGKKVIVTSVDPGVIDPNLGIQKATAIAPVEPFNVLVSGPDTAPSLELTYSGVLTPIGTDNIKSYFVVVDPTTRIRARTVAGFTGKVVRSNTINVTVTITDEANGVKLCDDLNDIEEGLLKRVKNINEITDEAVLQTSGELYPEYLEDAIRTLDDWFYTSWTGDINTISYWSLDSGVLLETQGWGDNDLTNSGNMQVTQGFVDSGYRSTGAYQYLSAAGIYNDLCLTSGTIDFMFRTGDMVVSGFSVGLMQITVTGTNNLRNDLDLYVVQTANSGVRLRFNYEISGVGNGPTAYLEDNLIDKGIYITDSGWHAVRLTWDYQPDNPANYEAGGTIRLGAQVDNVTLSGGQMWQHINYPINGTVKLTNHTPLEAVVGDLTSSGNFYFDEIRYSDTIRTDPWPPRRENETLEDYITWFRRTRKADSERLLLQNVTFSGYVPSRIPIGFRLKSSGFTIASMLDRVTFLTPNDYLDDDYFE